MNFDNVFFPNKMRKVFLSKNSANVLMLTYNEYRSFADLGLVTILAKSDNWLVDPSVKSACVYTDKGLCYYQFLIEQKRRNRNFITRWTVMFLVAVIAVIVGIFAIR